MQEQLILPQDDMQYFVEDVEDQSRPDIALDDLAANTDPVGLLARRLKVVEEQSPQEPYRMIIRTATQAAREARAKSAFSSLEESHEPPTEEDIRLMLLTSGWLMLETLLGQKEAAE